MARIWDEFRAVPDIRRPDQMRVSINERGIISLNRRAWEALKEPEDVVLVYDRLNCVIGLKPAHPRLDNAVPVRNFNAKGGRFVLRAISMCVHIGITIGRTLIFRSPVIDDTGVLELDLRDTYEFVQRRRRYESEAEVLVA